MIDIAVIEGMLKQIKEWRNEEEKSADLDDRIGLQYYIAKKQEELGRYLEDNYELPVSVIESDLPSVVNLPEKYWPKNGGTHLSICPPVLKARAEAYNRLPYSNDIDVQASVILWLLDQIDWSKCINES